MPGILPILIIPLMLLAVAAAIYFGWQSQQKRRDEMQQLARQLGLSFDPSSDASHDEKYAQFEIFRRGHSRAASNTLEGSIDVSGRAWPIRMGDFTYKVTTSTGKSTQTTTYRFSYVIVHLPWRSVPDLLIRREGVFDKLAGAFGIDDIDFESAEFSRKFHVKSPDKRFAYDVCHPRMMEFLMQSVAPCVDIEQGCCCLSDGTRRWTTDEFRAMLRWSREFFSRWPEHLTSQLQS
jgi:hypothetical protein